MRKLTRALAPLLLILTLSTAALGGDMPTPAPAPPNGISQQSAHDGALSPEPGDLEGDEGAGAVSEGIVASFLSFARETFVGWLF